MKKIESLALMLLTLFLLLVAMNAMMDPEGPPADVETFQPISREKSHAN